MRHAAIALIALIALSAVGGVACDDVARRPAPSTSGPRKPSCDLPVCMPCACDTTTGCDPDCNACDPECGDCRAEGAECVTPRDAGPVVPQDDAGAVGGRDAAPLRVDAGPCAFALSQGLSEPCCTQNGIDACGAGLFCAAFDGRTQATCYAEASRRDGQECGADLHCSGGRCPQTTQVCGPGPGDPCSASGTPCAPAPNGAMYFCDQNLRRCAPSPIACDLETHQPCGPGESCYLDVDGSGMLFTVCGLTGTRGDNEGCEAASDCARDFLCLAPFGLGCRRRCSDTQPCPTGDCMRVVLGAGQPAVGVCIGGG